MNKVLIALATLVMLSGCYTLLETSSADDVSTSDGPPWWDPGPDPMPPPPVCWPAPPVVRPEPVRPEPVRTIGSTRGEHDTGSGEQRRDVGSQRRP